MKEKLFGTEYREFQFEKLTENNYQEVLGFFTNYLDDIRRIIPISEENILFLLHNLRNFIAANFLNIGLLLNKDYKIFDDDKDFRRRFNKTTNIDKIKETFCQFRRVLFLLKEKNKDELKLIDLFLFNNKEHFNDTIETVDKLESFLIDLPGNKMRIKEILETYSETISLKIDEITKINLINN